MDYSNWEVLTPDGFKPFFGVRKLQKKKYVHIFLSNDELKCSLDHLIKSVSGWKRAYELKELDKVETISGLQTIIKINVINEIVDVYDLIEVENKHEYYTNNILSHNCQFLGSSGTLIAGWKLKELVHQTPINEKDHLLQYDEPLPNHSYVMVCDVSEGKGLDYSAFQIIDVTSMPYKQVCTFNDNTIVPADYAEVIYRIGKLYNNASVLIEINSLGDQVAQNLIRELEYENVLRTENNGRSGKQITLVPKKNADNGIRTTTLTKATGCSILKLLIEQNQLIINDFNTIEQLSRFSKKANSYQAESGSNDDLIMPLVLFAWLSDQKYFKELTDIDTIAKMKEIDREQMNEKTISFGYITDGTEEHTRKPLQSFYDSNYIEVMENVIDFDKWMRD